MSWTAKPLCRTSLEREMIEEQVRVLSPAEIAALAPSIAPLVRRAVEVRPFYWEGQSRRRPARSSRDELR